MADCVNYIAQFLAFVLISIGPFLMIIGSVGNNWWVQSNGAYKAGLFRECNPDCHSMNSPSSADVAVKFFAILAIVASIMTLFVFLVNFIGRFCRRPAPTNPVEVAHERKRQKTEALLMGVTPLVSFSCGMLVIIIWCAENPDNKKGYRYGYDFYFWLLGTFFTLLLYIFFSFIPMVKTRVLGHASFEDDNDAFDMPTSNSVANRSTAALAETSPAPKEADSADVVGDDERMPATNDAVELQQQQQRNDDADEEV